MKTIADLMKGYYSDKNNHPWHKLVNNIETFIKDESSNEKISEVLILIRAAVFGALDILSFGLVDAIATEDLIKAFTEEKTWDLGRRKIRNLCLDVADILIEKGETRYLLPSALKRDGFGFLLHRVEEAQWEEFKKAKPKVVRGKLNLTDLEKSLAGSKFLRQQMIMETKMDANDPRAEALIEAYDLQLIEIEVDRSSRIKPPPPTEQVTLNGQPIFEDEEGKEEKIKRKSSKSAQTPLTDFLVEEDKSTKTPKKKSITKKGGQKK